MRYFLQRCNWVERNLTLLYHLEAPLHLQQLVGAASNIAISLGLLEKCVFEYSCHGLVTSGPERHPLSTCIDPPETGIPKFFKIQKMQCHLRRSSSDPFLVCTTDGPIKYGFKANFDDHFDHCCSTVARNASRWQALDIGFHVACWPGR